MAKFVVGDIVYPSYTPIKAGRVVAIAPGIVSTLNGKPFQRADQVTVKTLSGQVFTQSELTLRRYEDLVEDHRRHKATLDKIKAMP